MRFRLTSFAKRGRSPRWARETYHSRETRQLPANSPFPGTAPWAGNAPVPGANNGGGRDALRTWTDNAGRGLGEAQFDRLYSGRISLKTAGGRRFVPWDSLSEADQAWVRENGGPVSGARAIRLWKYKNGDPVGNAWFWARQRTEASSCGWTTGGRSGAL